MEVSHVSQINGVHLKSAKRFEGNVINKPRTVFSNISNIFSNVDKVNNIKSEKLAEEYAVPSNTLKGKELHAIKTEIKSPIIEENEDLECDELFFSNEVEDEYNDILPKSLQLTDDTIHKLMGFIDSYENNNSVCLQPTDILVLPEPLYDWSIEFQDHLDYIFDKDCENVPFPE